MGKKCIVSAVVMFVMALALSFLVHGVILLGDYAVTPGMRPMAEANALIPYMVLAQAFFGIAFAWVYVQGKEDRPWLPQGFRFGIAIAFLTVIPTYLIYHVVTPVPLALALKQIGFDTVRLVLMGVVLAWINR
ncbi:MAG TPA: hypothetical protein VJZ74_03240 [Pseudolabrys sp.]|nr:hypothetical protein [Pseudolabrys sp.]